LGLARLHCLQTILNSTNDCKHATMDTMKISRRLRRAQCQIVSLHFKFLDTYFLIRGFLSSKGIHCFFQPSNVRVTELPKTEFVTYLKSEIILWQQQAWCLGYTSVLIAAKSEGDIGSGANSSLTKLHNIRRIRGSFNCGQTCSIMHRNIHLNLCGITLIILSTTFILFLEYMLSLFLMYLPQFKNENNLCTRSKAQVSMILHWWGLEMKWRNCPTWTFNALTYIVVNSMWWHFPQLMFYYKWEWSYTYIKHFKYTRILFKFFIFILLFKKIF